MICDRDDNCYGCVLRRKSVAVSPSATPNRSANRPQPFREMREPSWEKGIAGEHRPGGGFVPYLNPDGSRMGVKELADRRGHVEAGIKRLKTDPHVFSKGH